MGLFGLFGGRDLKTMVKPEKRVKVQGVLFTIRKIDPISYFKKSQTLLAEFQSWGDHFGKKEHDSKANYEKLEKKNREHLRDVFLECVVRPKLSKDGAGETVNVNEVLMEQELSNELYQRIIEFTYGKKKLK